MDGLRGRSLYQLHSLGAAGAPAANADVDAPAPNGRGLRRLQTWLDHVVALGAGGVLLTPIFVSSTHGYDTVDPFRIDQRLGDDDDFAGFVDACHHRDLAVILDGVFNHVGRAFGPFRDVLARGASSDFAEWFRLDFARDDGDGFAYRTFEGHRELVALNHRMPAVLDWAEAVSRHWLDRGADGWRFDAAYAIPRPFLAALTERIRATHHGAFLFGEMIHGDYGGFVAETGLDAVTQYELHKAIWSSLNDENFFELAWALERHRDFASQFVPVTFAGNHDVTRLATQLREPTLAGCALAVVFTVPGLPCVYYGDEFAWPGRKEHRPGGDDAIRPALPERPEPVDAAQQHALEQHRSLIAMRRMRPWLATATLEIVERANRRIAFTVTGDASALTVTLDVGDADVRVRGGETLVVRGRGFAIGERAIT